MNRRSRRHHGPVRRSSSLCTERGSIPLLSSLSRSDSAASNLADVGSPLVDLFPLRTQSPVEFPTDQHSQYPTPQVRPTRPQISTGKQEEVLGSSTMYARPDSCPPDLNAFSASLRAMGMDSYYVISPRSESSDSDSDSDSDSGLDHSSSAEKGITPNQTWGMRRRAVMLDPDQLDMEFQHLLASREVEEPRTNKSQSEYNAKDFGYLKAQETHGATHSDYERGRKNGLENTNKHMFANKDLHPSQIKPAMKSHQIRLPAPEGSLCWPEAHVYPLNTRLNRLDAPGPTVWDSQNPISSYEQNLPLLSGPHKNGMGKEPGVPLTGLNKPYLDTVRHKKQVRIGPTTNIDSNRPGLCYEGVRQPPSPSGSSPISESITWPRTPPNDARMIQIVGAPEDSKSPARQRLHKESRKISRNMPISEIVTRLVKHGCQNLTDQLNLTTFDQYPIATGGFSDVYYGKLHNGQKVGVKALRVDAQSLSQNPKHLKRAARELHTWSKCSHPNVLKLFGLAVFRDRIGMVSPWMSNGNLHQYLQQNTDVNKSTLCAQVADGLTYMHGIGIAHGDIKGANVLVSSNGVPALTDFGNSDLQERTLGFTQSTTGGALTLRWSAPEVINGVCACDKAADIYALGMTILEVFTSKQPFYYIKSESTVMVRVLTKKEIPRRPKAIPTNSWDGDIIWNLLVACWSNEPGARPAGAVISKTLRKVNL